MQQSIPRGMKGFGLQQRPGAAVQSTRLVNKGSLLPRPAPKSQPSVQVNSLGWDFLRPADAMEQDRKDWRSVYDHAAWQKHRSPVRLVDRLMSIQASKVIKNIVPSMFWVGSLSTALFVYHYALQDGLLPEGFTDIAPNAACKTFITNTSVALSLLLVFRTNASYGRWDEARKLWGLLVNRSRDMARQTMVLFPDSDPEAKAAMSRWLAAFPRVLRIFLQPEVTLDDELKNILHPKEVEMLKRSANPTVKAIHALSEIMHKAVRDPAQQLQMSNNLTTYHDVLGGCERLLRAPIPVSYTRHTARFLFAWITLLPFTIDPKGPADIAVTVGIAGVLAAIEEIGVQCEEPFGVLPLAVICNRIQTDVENTLKDDTATKAILKESADLPETQQPVVQQRSNGVAHSAKPSDPVVVYTDYYM